MIVYLDTSALLRIVLRERGALDDLRASDGLVSSEIIVVESLRTLDRLRMQGELDAGEAASRRSIVGDWLDAIDLVLLQRPILARASEPLPVPLGTLDAIHLASMLVWRERMGSELTVATHDAVLGLAARSFGLDVIGV